MPKTILPYLLFTALASSSSFASQTTNTNLAPHTKNLVGSWHCKANATHIRYEAEIIYHANQNYTDNGMAYIKNNGKWVSIGYQGTGKWELNSARLLNIKNYTAQQLNPTMNDEQQPINQIHLLPSFNTPIEIIRLGSQILVLQIKDANNTAFTARCSKRNKA